MFDTSPSHTLDEEALGWGVQLDLATWCGRKAHRWGELFCGVKCSTVRGFKFRRSVSSVISDCAGTCLSFSEVERDTFRCICLGEGGSGCWGHIPVNVLKAGSAEDEATRHFERHINENETLSQRRKLRGDTRARATET